MDKDELSRLTTEELQHFITVCKEVLAERATGKRRKFLFNPYNQFERYNGGWTKCVVGLDKSKTDGYSLVGNFKGQRTEWYVEGNLYLDCGIGGSRKNQHKTYTLFTFTEDDKIDTLQVVEGHYDWAPQFWPTIEKYLQEHTRCKIEDAIEYKGDVTMSN